MIKIKINLIQKKLLSHLINSIKLKNETGQILYSLYRSKALAKTVYNRLIKSI